MHPRVVAERRAQAQARMTEAAGVLTDRFGVTMEAPPPARFMGQDVADLLALEQTATFMEALIAATDPGGGGPTEADTMAELTVSELRERIATADSDTLDRLRALEHAGKQRRGVLAAIDERRAVLMADQPVPATEA